MAPADSAVKTLPNLLHGRVRFLTASSAPAHWKVLTSASPLQLQSFVFCSLRVSFHHSFVEQKHKKKPWKLTAPWYISTSLSPKYGICLKGLTEMSTGPMYVWRVWILKNIMWRKAHHLHYKGSGWTLCNASWIESVVLLLGLAFEEHNWFFSPTTSKPTDLLLQIHFYLL